MKVLVTGATGLLGSHVVDLLLERGERPRILVHPNARANGVAHSGLDVMWGKIEDRASLGAAMIGVDTVLHCAARTGPWGRGADYEAVNVRGLETLVEIALAAGVRRIVHVSSITVHGNDVHGVANEDAPFRAEHNPYSRSKVAGERVLEALIRDRAAPVTIVRPGWIYGPRDVASFGRFAALILERRMIVVGSGENRVPLIYVRDAAKGLLLAADARQAVGRTYLLVNDEPVTQRDYLNAIADELGAPQPNRHIPYRLGVLLGAVAETGARLTLREKPPPFMRYGIQLLGGENAFDVGRARRELGFSPEVGYVEGVRRTAGWYRETLSATG
jgi:2-alkyl-3-oxoalkanoate reductase